MVLKKYIYILGNFHGVSTGIPNKMSNMFSIITIEMTKTHCAPRVLSENSSL